MTVIFPDLLTTWGLSLSAFLTLFAVLMPTAGGHGIIGAGGSEQTMQTLDKIPQLTPQVLMRAPKHLWLLTLALIVLYFVMQSADRVLPIPVPLLLMSVAISGALAGRQSGTISGLLISAFIMYWWSIGIGPERLTGTLARALIACTLSTTLGIFLGAMRDYVVGSFEQLRASREELAVFGDELATRVARQTRDLEAAHDKLRKQQDRLQSITKRWIDSQEIERRALSRDLHDDVGQILTALRITLDSGRRAADPDSPAASLLGKSTGLVDTAIDSVRQLSFSLRPSLLDDLGLTAAIREHTSRLLHDDDIDFQLSSEGDDSNVVPEIGIVAFRISQEAISNVVKHADAKSIKMSVLTDEDSLCVEISDDGRGFDISEERNLTEHFGLASMRERASLAGGSTVVESELGVGTEVRVCLPIAKGRSTA